MTPIRASERDRYPPNWSTEIRPAILARADGRCECLGECGHDHRAETGDVLGLPTGRDVAAEVREPDRCIARDRRDHPVTGSRVVLTVAHRDHTPEHCDESNLFAACQRCHLAYDRDHHAETRRATRRAALGATLFDLPNEGD